MSIPLTPKEHATALLGYLKPEQLDALIPLLATMVPTLERNLAAAPWDDEPVSEEEMRDIEESRIWREKNSPISNAEVLAEYGLTEEEFDRMRKARLKVPEKEVA